MGTSMEHWNGDQICAVDVETTGLDPAFHEVIQIALVALDSNLVPRKEVMPFYIELIPDNPERAEPEAMEVSKLKLAEIALRGHDREKAKDMLVEWTKKLNLHCTKWGNPKRLLLLGHNAAAFDVPFIKAWLGPKMFDEIFDGRVRDTMITAAYLNDRAAMHCEKIPYFKINLAWCAKVHEIHHERGHDALQDCLTTAALYKAMTQKGLML